jgi:hypothetical protein
MTRETEIASIVEYALATGWSLDVLIYLLALAAEPAALPVREKPTFSTHVYVH